MYFEYEYSVTFVISIAFSFLLIRVIGEITETFSEPQVMWHITVNAILTYLYGCFALHKSSHRRELYFDLIKYGFLFLFYAKSYPFGQNLLPAFTLYSAMLNRALWYMNNISFQHERLLMTTQQGFSEVLAMSLNENLRDSVHQDLEEDLREEILDQAKRHKLKSVKGNRR